MSASKQQKERDKAIRHLFDFIERSPRWKPLLDDLTRQYIQPVAAQLDEDVDMIDIRLQGGPYGSMMFGFIMELMAVTRWDNENETPIDEYLQKRGWREGTHGRRYLNALVESELVFLEVTNVDPGRWVEVRPYGTTEAVMRIVEHSASQSLHPYDAVVARLVTLGKSQRFGSILPLSPDGRSYLQEQLDSVESDLEQWYEELVAEEGPDGLVENFANEIPMERQRRTDEYGFMCWAIDVLDPPPMIAPQMHNTDNERIVMTKTRFPLTGDAEIIRQQFALYEELIDDGDDHWSWLKLDGSNTVLGRFMLRKSELVFETNSVERGKQGETFMQAFVVDGLIGKPLTVHENLNDLMSSGATAPTSPSSLSSDELQQLPEVQALLQKTMKDHYLKTLDEPIPMLDNDSPRDCAADPDKQSKVIVWLKSLENMEAKAPGPAQDFGWLWDELGLAAYR